MICVCVCVCVCCGGSLVQWLCFWAPNPRVLGSKPAKALQLWLWARHFIPHCSSVPSCKIGTWLWLWWQKGQYHQVPSGVQVWIWCDTPCNYRSLVSSSQGTVYPADCLLMVHGHHDHQARMESEEGHTVNYVTILRRKCRGGRRLWTMQECYSMWSWSSWFHFV